MYLIFLSNFPFLAQKIIANTSSSLEFSQRFNSDVILEAVIGVCIHEWSKIQYVNKGVVKRSLIGSSTWVIGPLANLSGFHSIYEIGKRQRKYRLSNAHEIRKYFGNKQTTNSWAVLRFCFVYTAPFLNITTLRKSGSRALRLTRTGTYGLGRASLSGCIGLHLIIYGIHITPPDRQWAMSYLNTPPVRNRAPLAAQSSSLSCVLATVHHTPKRGGQNPESISQEVIYHGTIARTFSR